MDDFPIRVHTKISQYDEVIFPPLPIASMARELLTKTMQIPPKLPQQSKISN